MIFLGLNRYRGWSVNTGLWSVENEGICFILTGGSPVNKHCHLFNSFLSLRKGILLRGSYGNLLVDI